MSKAAAARRTQSGPGCQRAKSSAVGRWVKLRGLASQGRRLFLRRAPHDGAVHAMSANVGHEVECAGEERVLHRSLIVVYHLHHVGPLFGREIAFENLLERGSLDEQFQMVDVGAEGSAYLVPDDRILTLGVDERAVEVKKCGLKSSHCSRF